MKTIMVNASSTYQVHVGEGLLAQVGALSAPLLQGERGVIVSDDTVWKLHGERVQKSLHEAGIEADSFVFPAGERAKNTQTLVQLLEYLAQKNLTRADTVFALGGGVTGDLAGLAAALYLRGVPCVQLPTSLLAMVDSSVGGKTAVDLPQGKNLVGTFTQPRLVLCDTAALQTLPQEVAAQGWAEIIKYGMIASKPLLDALSKGAEKTDLPWVIAHCLDIKRAVVAQDEFDNGQRQMLNFGHTIGHAIERCSAFEISHGAGVAMGMAIMTRACVRLGRCERACQDVLQQLLKQYQLPDTCAFSVEQLLASAQADKKRRGGDITLIEPVELGRCALHKTDDAMLERILHEGLQP